MKALVIARDRVTYTRQCVRRLLDVGLDVHIVDHGSTYPPMLDFLGKAAGAVYDGHSEPVGRVHVHWKPDAHPRDIWANGTVASIVHPAERYIVTDCDILAPDNPGWLTTLHLLLDARPDVVKAGCGLVTEDLPDHYVHADRVREWESNYQSVARLRRVPVKNITPGMAEIVQVPYFDASVDTTLAMYRPLAEGGNAFALDPAVRTAAADLRARHLPWYEDSANESAELAYYREHAMQGVSNWLDPDGYVGDHGLTAEMRHAPLPTTDATEVVDG